MILLALLAVIVAVVVLVWLFKFWDWATQEADWRRIGSNACVAACVLGALGLGHAIRVLTGN